MRKGYKDLELFNDVLKMLELDEKLEETKKNVQNLAKDYLFTPNYLNDKKIDDLYERCNEAIVFIATDEAEAFLVSKTFEGIEKHQGFRRFKSDFVREVLRQVKEYQDEKLKEWAFGPDGLINLVL